MRAVLDRLFYHRKLSIIIPWVTVGLVCFLFLLFGSAENKGSTLMAMLIVTVFWFFGTFFMILFLIKVTSAPGWFLNLFSLAATIFFVGCGIIETISFVFSGFETLNPATCAGLITYAAVSWAHNRRTD